MATLADTQQQLFHYLQGKPSTIESMVTGKNAAAITRRLMIYRTSYQLRLHDHLIKQFPVVRSLLSKSAFSALALAYIDAYPPSHFAIRNFGDQLAAFLRIDPEYAAREQFSELAKLEWHLAEIIDQTADAPVLTVAHLAHIQPEDLPHTCFQLQDHVRIERFTYDVPPWRDALKKSVKGSAVPTRLKTAKYYALWRKGFQTYYRPLSDLDLSFALALQAGKNFTDLCAIPEALSADAAQIVVQTLLLWINDGWFTDALTSQKLED